MLHSGPRRGRLVTDATITAPGGKPMGRPPAPMDDSSRVQRARRVVAAAEDAARTPDQPTLAKKDLPKTVANTTDPQSRIMPTRRGFLQGYNAQVPFPATRSSLPCRCRAQAARLRARAAGADGGGQRPGPADRGRGRGRSAGVGGQSGGGRAGRGRGAGGGAGLVLLSREKVPVRDMAATFRNRWSSRTSSLIASGRWGVSSNAAGSCVEEAGPSGYLLAVRSSGA